MSTLLLSLVFSQRKEIAGLWAAAMAVVAVILVAAYVRRANRVPEPIIRPSLFADARFTIPNVLNALANLAGFSILLLTPYYLVNVLKLSPLGVGIVLAMAFGGSLTGAPLSAFLVRRIGQRPTVFAGIACVGLGLLPLGFTGIDTPVLVVAALLVLEGVGQGLLTVAYTDIVTATLPARDRGVAGSLSLLTRTIGIVAGASVLTALQAHGAQGFMHMAGFLAGYRFAFVAAGGGLLAVLLLSLLWPRVWSRDVKQTQGERRASRPVIGQSRRKSLQSPPAEGSAVASTKRKSANPASANTDS